jgi:hypothetical protein
VHKPAPSSPWGQRMLILCAGTLLPLMHFFCPPPKSPPPKSRGRTPPAAARPSYDESCSSYSYGYLRAVFRPDAFERMHGEKHQTVGACGTSVCSRANWSCGKPNLIIAVEDSQRCFSFQSVLEVFQFSHFGSRFGKLEDCLIARS